MLKNRHFPTIMKKRSFFIVLLLFLLSSMDLYARCVCSGTHVFGTWKSTGGCDGAPGITAIYDWTGEVMVVVRGNNCFRVMDAQKDAKKPLLIASK